MDEGRASLPDGWAGPLDRRPAPAVDLPNPGGADVDLRTYPGADHIGVVAADSPLVADLLDWTQERLAGEPSTARCRPGT